MKIAIIAAMHEECVNIRQTLNLQTSKKFLNMQINETNWSGHQLLLIESGIGKVNATLAAHHTLSAWQTDLVINTGSAGGIVKGAQICDYVIADKICHHDIDISPIGFKHGQLPNLPVYYNTDVTLTAQMFSLCQSLGLTAHHGNIASADTFVYKPSQLKHINQQFDDIVACEMEAGAVAQVCYLYNKPFIMVRNLSDIAGHNAPVNFQQHLEEAGQHSSQLVLEFIRRIDT